MDHLLDFPGEPLRKYDTTLENLQRLNDELVVPFKTRREYFEVDDFENLIKDRDGHTKDYYDNLLENGPEAIIQHKLSSKLDLEKSGDAEFEVDEPDKPDKPEEPDVEEFLQSWLFFSLISRVVGERIDVKSFIRQDSSQVHTSNLRRLLNKWRLKEKSQRDLDPGRQHSIDLALDNASRFVSQWCRSIDKWNISPILWLSFAIIGETLTRARLKVLKDSDDGGAYERRWGTSEFLREIVIKRGWCPSMARMFESTVGSLSGLYVLGSLTPPKDHIQVTSRPADEPIHKQCTEFMCSAYVISEPDSKFPLHSTVECPLTKSNINGVAKMNCRALGPDRRKLEEILLRGNIPLVRLSIKSAEGGHRSNFKKEVLQLHEYSLETNRVASYNAHQPEVPEQVSSNESVKQPASSCYVAISHVWSDGLGNPTGNTLHLCRLLEIQEMVNKLYPDREDNNSLFWLDTFCIPRADVSLGVEESTRLNQCRKAAIKGMNQVYSRSDKVLVLDQGLQQFDRNNGLEPLLRINLSSWSRRLWTLQEGTLCNKLYFRFAGGKLLSPTDIQERFMAADDDSLHMGWIDCAQIFSPTIRSLGDRSNEHIVAHAWQAVQWRTSEKLQDETLCLATLLELDPTLLFDPKEHQEKQNRKKNQKDADENRNEKEILDQKMCRFWSLVDEKYGIPSGFLFLPGPKVDVDGFRWAPRTWMASAERQFPYPLFLEGEEKRPTFLTTKGLLVQHEGIRLLAKPKPPGEEFMVSIRGLSLLIERATDKCRYPVEQKQENWCESDQSTLLLIFCRSDPESRPEIALLVSLVNERAPVKWVYYLARVWVSPISQPKKLAELNSGLRLNSGIAVKGLRIKTIQYWCVDGTKSTTPGEGEERPDESVLVGHKARNETSQQPVVRELEKERPQETRPSRDPSREPALSEVRYPRRKATVSEVRDPRREADELGLKNRIFNLNPSPQLRAPPLVPRKPPFLGRSALQEMGSS